MTTEFILGFSCGWIAWDCIMRIARWVDIQVFIKQCKSKADECAERQKLNAERERILADIGRELKKKDE